MSLIKKISSRLLGSNKDRLADEAIKNATLRRCRFELMEDRKVLSADPVIAGVTYLEGDGGQDTTSDHFEVSFEGGAETTQLTQFVINGDQDSSGDLSTGDVFFDANEGPPGTGGSHDFAFDAANSFGVSASDVRGFSVSEDGLSLTVEVDNFEAGDIFAFTIDVDEVEGFRNDKIASGVEFEGSFFTASFVDENFTFENLTVTASEELEGGVFQPQREGIFYDEYDTILANGETLVGSSIELQRDNQTLQANRTAGAIDAYELIEKPISISGTVYHDEDLDCVHDVDEDGIANVVIELQLLNESTGIYETVASTTTDSSGGYEFGTDLGLKPGNYQLVQQQPEGFLDVGAEAGSEGGDVLADGSGSDNVISNIEIALGNTAATSYDFKEVRPASISGNVWHDENNDGVFDPNEDGIADVLIQVTRVGAKDGVTSDPFAGSAPVFVRTDAQGHYSADGLPPGIYEVVEVNNDPISRNALAPFVDGKDSLGNVLDVANGQVSNDRFSQIVLCADDHGEEYNFGEVQHASISGYVAIDQPGQGKLSPDDPNFRPIEGVTIQLFNEANELVAETQTDATGKYTFGELLPGTYSVAEVQPDGYLDGGDAIGNVDGVSNGNVDNDRFSQIELTSGQEAVNYNFCEIEPASIKGNVYHDRNNNGIQEAGEEGIEGVVIELFDTEGNLVQTAVTDENGVYCFEDLVPGEYKIREQQPTDFLDGKETLGTVDGVQNGELGENDVICVTVDSGDESINNDFGELEPASIKGTVYHDRNNNGIQEAGEEGIEGVVIELFDDEGNLVQTAVTDENGVYCFEDLPPGEYKIREQQPAGFVDGIDTLGTVDGVENGVLGDNDEFCVTVDSGDEAIDNDFGELKLSEISGFVHVDNDGDCEFGTTPSDRPIEGTVLELLNANGEVIATTTTDATGAYSFGSLLPGTYSIRQNQPDGFFSGGEVAGDNGGTTSSNLISNIVVESAQNVTQYNFCETEAAEIHGRVWQDGPAFETEDGTLPTDYRSQRDGIYQEGVDTAIAGVRMQLYYFIDPTAGAEGELAPRPVTISEVLPEFYDNIDASNPDSPVFVETDANGQYWFQGLQPGSYVVLEVQPDGFVDANDVPGTTTGFTFNSEGDTQTAIAPLTRVFSDVQLMDAVAGISVNAGGVSLQNNFTEVAFTITPPDSTPPINPSTPTTPRPPGNPTTPSAGVTGLGGLSGSEPSAFTQFVGTGSGNFQSQQNGVEQDAYTWHLSVVNGGLPRAAGGDGNDDSIWQQAGFIGSDEWNRFDMTEAVWSYTALDEDGNIKKINKTSTFGMIGGTPLAGDFDGDGTDEIAIFNSGYWLIDINHNGRWDDQDLFAKLGDAEDRPVVGDWDGDGKDDIGIFGPIWERDREAIERDPGLPNPDNSPLTRPKNVPPTDADATNGARVMKLTSFGKQRADVVDHVFGTEDGIITPVTGDWNGNGIRSIGRFLDGEWDIDVDGNGRFDGSDQSFRFGQKGDIPLVGDFNGDGIEEIAVYRSGKWLIDINGNRELDATDKTFEMGGAGDKPVVGDFNGDGIDEPALYSAKQTENIQL